MHKFGPPNEEAIAGHPLYDRGIKPYSLFKVHASTRIEELEKMNSHHDKKRFDALNHFIFVFHDSTFECAADEMSFEIKFGSMRKILKDFADKL